MASFDRPEMYMPYPARCNPNLESARSNTKAWAVRVGMLHEPAKERDVAVWDEQKFDEMDVALFAALLYPDASGPELDLLAEWHIWIFYYDDNFLGIYKRDGDLAGAKEHV